MYRPRKSPWTSLAIWLIALATALAACAAPATQLGREAPAQPTAAPAAETKPAAPAPTQAAKPAAADDEAALVEGAKKEGRITWVAVTSSQTAAKSIEEGFRQKYNLPSSFAVEWVNLDTARTITRVNDELKAGKLSVDVPWIGVPAFYKDLESRGELLAYTPPEWKNFTLAEKAGLPSRPPYSYVPNGYSFAIGWNTNFYKGELTSWRDLLNPSFKGKISQGDVRKGETYTYTYMGVKRAAGDDFFKELGKLEPALILPNLEMMQKATAGEYPIWSFAGPYVVYRQLRDQPDTPLRVAYPKEGVVLLPITMAIMAKAPHPNAAKLFVNYIMSEEGQLRVVKGDGLHSLRANLPVPADVAKFSPPVEQIKTIPLDYAKITTEEIAAEQKKFRTDLGVD